MLFLQQPWNPTDASEKEITVTGRLHSGSGLEWTLVPQIVQESQNSLTCPIFFFTWLTKLPFCVSLALNRRKVNIISDPYKYMLLVVGFYQRSVLLFFYGFRFNCYIKDLPIQKTVSLCSSTGGCMIRGIQTLQI